jgi:C4-dicarboxylate-specific signal transduction histidine kinase
LDQRIEQYLGIKGHCAPARLLRPDSEVRNSSEIHGIMSLFRTKVVPANCRETTYFTGTNSAIVCPAIHGVRVQLQPVILNLLHNGSDAMVSVNDRPRLLMIQTETDGNQVTVSVRDSGVGFSSEIKIRERLFEPFFTTKQEGMGIGLSVSRSIVGDLHGPLWAARNDGPGATFAFSIPQDVENLHVK